MLNWLGHEVAGISELALFMPAMKHLLYELLLLLLEQLLPRNPLTSRFLLTG